MRHRGFTLIEMLVSVAIFSLVMVVALGALLALSEANRKAELLSEAINNFNSAVDSMSRSIRTGSQYHCGTGVFTAPADCKTTGSNTFAYLPNGATQPTIYKYSSTNCTNGVPGCILRSIDGGATFASITTPDVIITSLGFYVIGSPIGVQSPEGISIQPKVMMLISGYVQVKGDQKTVFNIQTSVTQRLYDQ